MTDDATILEGQLRECYGRVVYTHKTHEICADLLLTRNATIKFWQIALAALVTGGILATFADAARTIATVISAVLSTMLLALNTYLKHHDLGELAQKHRQAAAGIWLIREKYLTLLTDLRSGAAPLEQIRAQRDTLLADLHASYVAAPSTNFHAYQKAQHALKVAEDMTFSDKEIDAFLPKELKRGP